MKKILVLLVVGALAVGVLGPAAAKKKKKPKAPVPVELQYFLRTDADCAAPFLSLKDAEDGDCIYGDGGLADVYSQSGLLDMTSHYVAADGLPVTLDPTRHVTGEVAIRGWNGTGVGAAEIEFTLIATIAGEEKELGTYSESYTAGPQETKVIAFEMTLDPALAGATVEALTLDVNAHGVTVGGRGVEHDEPVSSIQVPALQ